MWGFYEGHFSKTAYVQQKFKTLHKFPILFRYNLTYSSTMELKKQVQLKEVRYQI